jgi:hypothetical protein
MTKKITKAKHIKLKQNNIVMSVCKNKPIAIYRGSRIKLIIYQNKKVLIILESANIPNILILIKSTSFRKKVKFKIKVCTAPNGLKKMAQLKKWK